MSALVIVESPSKAKTLKKYLGAEYEILASYGHVRDLVPKTGAVDTDSDFAMKYQLIERNERHVDAILRAAKKADRILLATDPDREGEAIAWHLAEILREKKITPKKPIARIEFHEITQSAIQHAVDNPREIAMPLVDAQQARRALDYLVGFNLSPLLWRKISPGLSAGRVQSPALRLIVERELEIEKFVAREYWSIHLDSHKANQPFSARLIQFNGEKLEQFSVPTADAQQSILDQLAAHKTGTVSRVEKKRKSRNAAAPFTTSTLQQEAVRKLGMTTDRAMRTAQQLYEGIDTGSGAVGLITYMRTDSVNLAREAIDDIRHYIQRNFDAGYLPAAPVYFRNKSKNAQEAHEAIRPTAIARTPDSVRKFLTIDQARLYEMIWKRTLACQMTPAQFDTVSLDIAVGSPANLFRATGQTLVFPGFIAVYQENQDDAAEEDDAKLPVLVEGETIPVDKLSGEQHFTQPPPRYTEASLVKTLEEYGIGRPSTYASIISTLQDREYVVLDKKRFMPTPTGRLVNCFLTTHFTHYVDYDFTAKLEDKLDDVSNGELKYLPLLHEFWDDFAGTLAAKADVERGCPIEDEVCPKCGGKLFLQASKRGLFIGCSGYPACDYTRPLHGGNEEGPVVLGNDPASGEDILLLNGRYGWYVQVGATPEDKKIKPRRASWPKTLPIETADLPTALRLLSLPREVGAHPDTGLTIVANIGRFGPYLQHDGKFKSIPKDDDVYTIALPRALEVLLMERAPRGGAPAGKPLGNHPEDGKTVTLNEGRYGWYVKHGAVNATLPKDMTPDTVTLEQALPLLAERASKGKPARKKIAAKAKPASTAKKATAVKKPAATKKPAVKKATATKTEKKPVKPKTET
ncbi:DNA topoisomerase I [Sulfuriferula sp. AH1]|uniref:type I DNA topoisomerase n=1 Tax=Sulfuriferula sp. AH1 TaxID=1985873 RepID=UPI000B3B50C0|nr:type I DNA topoisomerase [Sulfuriferula sp. AH1]ARU30328.1 DNA topoisomerase I [Sulfuriferula sp. AH1]